MKVNGSDNTESAHRTALIHLYNALPTGTINPDELIEIDPLLESCPECGAPIAVRLYEIVENGDSVHTALACTQMSIRPHTMGAELWQERARRVHDIVEQLWFFKANGLPVDQPLNEEQGEVLRKRMERRVKGEE